jgi:hypothetical protein
MIMLVELLGMRARVARVHHFCFVSSKYLEMLLAEPGAASLILRELGEEPGLGVSDLDLIKQLRRRAIHLSLSPASPYTSLSIEEVVVICAYQCGRFSSGAWKRSLTQGSSPERLAALAGRWLSNADTSLDSTLSRKGWAVGRQARLDVVRAIAPVADGLRLRRDIDRLLGEAVFADQSFVLCTSSTAIDFLDLEACLATTGRYDVSALERKLRETGTGLLLVDGDEATLAIEARGRDFGDSGPTTGSNRKC